MYYIDDNENDLHGWIKKEIHFSGDIKNGKRGIAAQRVQEWLSLHGHQLEVDGDFGNVTEDTVRDFQKAKRLSVSGVVDEETFAKLVAPMRTVLSFKSKSGNNLGKGALAVANAHLKQHPREVGGANKGPWVRLYMKGNEGRPWAWCAGFTTFCMYQAAGAQSLDVPIKGSFSCDSLAAQAKTAGVFLRERDASPEKLTPGAMFLNRRTSTDWTHVGFVNSAQPSSFSTVEGNTNDDGDREGYEVCARRRGYSNKDYIIF